MKYGKAYGGADPEMTEGDWFQVIVKYPYFEARPTDPTELRPEPEAQSRLESRLKSRLESRLAAKGILLVKDVEVGKAQQATGLGHKTVSGEWHMQIRRLLDLEMIEMNMPDKPKNRFTEIPTD
jgi:ATP-dependent DNA helicase RecG